MCSTLGHKLGPWFARLARMMIGSTKEAGGAATRMDDPRRYGELVLMVAVVRVGKMLSDGWLNGAQLSLSSLIRYTPLSMPRATSGERMYFSSDASARYWYVLYTRTLARYFASATRALAVHREKIRSHFLPRLSFCRVRLCSWRYLIPQRRRSWSPALSTCLLRSGARIL